MVGAGSLSDQGSSVRVITRQATHSLALPQLYPPLSNSSPSRLQRVIINSKCSFGSKLFRIFCHLDLHQGLNCRPRPDPQPAFNPDIYGRRADLPPLIISQHRPHSTNCRLPSSDHLCFCIQNNTNMVSGQIIDVKSSASFLLETICEMIPHPLIVSTNPLIVSTNFRPADIRHLEQSMYIGNLGDFCMRCFKSAQMMRGIMLQR